MITQLESTDSGLMGWGPNCWSQNLTFCRGRDYQSIIFDQIGVIKGPFHINLHQVSRLRLTSIWSRLVRTSTLLKIQDAKFHFERVKHIVFSSQYIWINWNTTRLTCTQFRGQSSNILPDDIDWNVCIDYF